MIYRNFFINTISFIIALIIFLSFNFIFFRLSKSSEENLNLEQVTESQEIIQSKTEEIEKTEENLGTWYIEIPSINLKAPIAEGTDSETLNTKVGHFKETSLNYGNIGLAAHNRGYEYNFFEHLKDLELDSEIFYFYEDIKRTYIVDKIEIIKNTDWSYLSSTDENKITLITCIENEPLYRRCVQGTEI